MALIKIDGVSIPTPSSYDVGINDISNAERNANGTMIIERIATKRKIELSWKVLSKEQVSDLYNRVRNTFFGVEYEDPQDGGKRRGTFYVGDRSCGALSYIDNRIKYKDVKFNLIER
ncbi:MAG: DUF6711 family protein [Clostridium sp.]|uniref:DUF6711 family protein n=1 Tax=Clostridium sp. TaxID=1506 RepID=UPI003F2A2FE8